MIGTVHPQLPPSRSIKGHARLTFGRLFGDTKTAGRRRYLADPNNEDLVSPRSYSGIAVPALPTATDVDQLADLDGAENGELCVAVVCQSFKKVSHTIRDTEKPPATASSRTNLFARLLRFVRFSREPHGGACLVLYQRLPGEVAAFPLNSPVFRLRQDFLHEKGDDMREASKTKRSLSWRLPLRGFEALLDLERRVVPGLPTLTQAMTADKNFVRGGKLLPAEVVRSGTSSDKPRAFLIVPRMLGIVVVSRPVPCLPRGSTAAPTACGGTSKALVARLESEGTTERCRFVFEHCDVRVVDGKVYFPVHKCRTPQTQTAKYVSLPTTYSMLLGEARSVRAPSSGFSPLRPRWLRLQHRRIHRGSTRIVPAFEEDILREEEKPFGGLETRSSDVQDRRHGSRSGGCEERRRDQYVDTGVDPRRLTVDGARSLPITAVTPHFVRELLAEACKGEIEQLNNTREEAQSVPRCVQARNAACALLARELKELPEKSGEEGRKPDATQGTRRAVMMGQWYEAFWSVLVSRGGDPRPLQPAARSLLEGLLAIPGVKLDFLHRGLLRWLSNSLRGSLARARNRGCACDVCNGRGEIRDLVGCSQVTFHPGNDKPCDEGVTKCVKTTTESELRPRGVDLSSVEYSTPPQGLNDAPWWLLRCDMEGVGEAKVLNNSRGSSASEDDLEVGGSTDAEAGCELASGGCPVGGKDTLLTSRDEAPVKPGRDPTGRLVEDASVTTIASARAEGSKWRGCGKDAVGGKEGIALRERIAPPMLRLDVLDRIFGKKDHTSPRYSSRVTAALSTASTRAPLRLSTFRSARGATSRASAGHDSGRSVRTGPATQRDSVSLGWPTERSFCSLVHTTDQDPPPRKSSPSTQDHAGDSSAGASPPKSCCECQHSDTSGVEQKLPGFVGSRYLVISRACDKADSKDPSTGFPRESSPWAPIVMTRPGVHPTTNIIDAAQRKHRTNSIQQTVPSAVREALEASEINASVVVHGSCGKPLNNSSDSPYETGMCRAVGLFDNISAALVLTITYASASPIHLSLPPQQQASRQNQGDVWTDLIADAKLVLTLLHPSAVPAQDAEEALRLALEILSTSIWSRHDAVLDTLESLTSKGNVRPVQDGTISRSAREAQGWQGLAPFPREFDSIDIVTLSNAIESAFDCRHLRLRAHFKADGDYAYGETASVSHRRWVHSACALCLESAWLIALLHKQVDSLISKADIRYTSFSPTEAVECTLSFCGRALESLRKSCFYSSFWLYSGEDTTRDQTKRMGVTASDCRNAGAFFLGAPVLFNLAATFITLLRRPKVWGEDLVWTGQTLRSIAHGNDTTPVSTLVVLFDLVMASNQERGVVMGAASSPPKRTSIGDGTTRGFTRGLTGDTYALDELLGSIVQSLVAVLHRSNTLMEMHRDLAWSKSRSTPTVESRAAATSPTGMDDKKTLGCDSRSRRTRDAVVEDSIRVVREKIAPAFRPKGPVHALLQDARFMRIQVNSAMNGQHETRSAASSHEYFPGVKISTSVLAATLRLGCIFFALQAKARYEDVGAGNKEGQGALGVFTAQIVSAFYGRCNEIFIGSEANFGVQACTREQISGETNGVEHKGKGFAILRQERNNNVLLCSLHLELLARLAALRDLSVQKHMREMQLPEFLVRYLVGGRTTKGQSRRSHPTTENSAQRLDDVETVGSKMRLGAEIEHPQNGATSTRGAGGRLQAYNEWKEEECVAETIAGKEQAHDSAAQRSPSCRSPNNTTCAIPPVPYRGDLAAGICGDRNGSQDPMLPTRIRGKSQAVFAPGDRIDGLIAFRDKRSRWFPGHVARTNEDGSLYICYDDGDENPAKASGEVRHGQKRSERDRKRCTAGHPESRVVAAAAAIGVINNLGSLKVKKSAAPEATPPTMDYAGHVRHYALSLVREATTSALASSAVRGLVDSADAHNEAASSIVDAEASDRDEDDDMCFVIPSVLKARVTIPVSLAPRIDLLSTTFCSRIRPAQLGPGSSLSAPTTGGSGEDALQKRSGSRSGVLASRRFPNGPAEKCSRTFVDGSPSALPSGDFSRALSVPTSTSAPPALMLKEQYPLTAPREGPDSAPVRLLSGEDEHEEREDDNMKSREIFVIDQEENNSHAKRRRVNESGMDSTEAQMLTDGVGTCSFHHSKNELRGMQACAISLLLSLASSPNSHGLQGEGGQSGPHYSPTSLCPGGIFLADTMTKVTLCLDDPENADVIMNLNARWCGNSMLEASSAVLTKLVCAALFDSESYSIDGQRIASGAFGGIVVSRSPLPIKPVAALPRRSDKADEGEASAPRKQFFLLTQTSTRSAEEHPHGDEVALKIVERDEVDETIGPSVFYEVLALRTLSHVSGVCRLYDFGVTPTAYVLVMERCPLSVRDWRAARGGVNYRGRNCAGEQGALPSGPGTDKDVALYLLVFRQVVAAVVAISERGVIHLDLKCDNVLVRKDRCDVSLALPRGLELVGDFAEVPCVCLADFGESIIGRRCKPSSSRTDASPPAHPFEFDVCGSRGTERIQSPEMIVLTDGSSGWRNLEVSTNTEQDGSQLGAHVMGEVVRDCNRIGTASDVWSLGCLLYELLTGKLLFENMQWSEFFVTLTGVGTLIEEESTAARAVAARSLAPPVLPAAALLPFSELGSAEVIEKLLKSILVRNAVKRPRASQVIRNIDKALGTIVTLIRAPLVTEDVRDIDSAHPMTKQSKDFIFGTKGTTGSTVRPTGNRFAGKEHIPVKENICGVQPVICNASLVWPLRPCAAVGAQQQLSERLSATSNCAGCFHQLGAGAFLLELNSSRTFSRVTGSVVTSECNRGVVVADVGKRSTSQVTPDESACPCPTCISSETPVVCFTSCADWTFKAEGYRANAESVPSSLGNIITTLGITHVVCVTSNDGSQDRLGDQKSRNGCCEPSPSKRRCMLGGCQLLNVQLPSKATGGEQKGSGSSLIELSFAQCVDDVLKFAIGSRALFVRTKGDRGAAGALAMAWAINRTGLGIFETMLDFRQSYPGFWVETDVLQSFFGL